MFVRTNSRLLAYALAPLLLIASGAAQASTQIDGVRFGLHEGFVRLVVDSEAPLVFKRVEDSYPFVILLPDAHCAPIDMAFAQSYAPLHHLTLDAQPEGATKLTVTATQKLSARFMQLDLDERGLYRLVIDLSIQDNLDHLSIGQEGLNSKRVRVQFGDSLTAGR
ncbi:MAG: hypothetical protein EP340_05545 [Alphaproteobacteria bacterium]|nr:MAG: hypothetical protein EP340_05545 [Alphaproteobacteria bacterium]